MVAPSDRSRDYRYIDIRDWLFWLMFFMDFLTVFRRKVGLLLDSGHDHFLEVGEVLLCCLP
jgi:hypothetical protein